MYDCHDDSTTNNTSYMRGFYIRKDIYKMAVCGKYDDSYLENTGGTEVIFYYKENRVDYEARRDAMNAIQVGNVKDCYNPDISH